MAKYIGIGYKNTEWYMHTVNNYRKALQDAHKAYDAAMQPYAGAEGSQLYEKKQKEANEKLKEAIQTAREAASHSFSTCLESMVENVNERKQGIPTAESMRLLEGLRMRSKLDSEIIEEASRTLADDPAALETLQDIAESKGIYGAVKGSRIGKKELVQVVECLARTKNKLLKLDNAIPEEDHEARAKAYYQHPVYGEAGCFNPTGARVDRNFTDSNDCLAYLGWTQRPSEIAPILDGTEK